RTLQSATFTLSAAAASITVNAEGRTISPTGATFTDTFGPFAAHVYVVANGGADNTTLNATPTAVTAGSAVTATWSGMGVSTTSAVAGAIVTAQWSGIASPTASDWIGLYAAGAPDSAYLAWVYVSCSQSAGNAATAGSCAFRLPATLTPGNYELRAFANDAFVRIA